MVIVDISANGKKGKALYDPGSNISVTPQDFFKNLYPKKFLPFKQKFTTLGGDKEILGIARVKIKVLNLEREIFVYVVSFRNYKFDMILGVDTIPTFGLGLDHDLKLSQHTRENSEKNINIHLFNKVNSVNSVFNDIVNKDSIKEKIKHLNSEESEQVRLLIFKYCTLFGKDKYDIGTISQYQAKVTLSKDVYIARKPYRCSFEDQAEIERQVGELLKHGMIKESSSSFASPVTLQYKKTAGTKQKNRLCVDYRALNKFIVPESQPFILIEDIITKTAGCSWFSALDINSAFWSIPIAEADRYKTAFITQRGHYEWVSMPFGLKIAPAIFQRILSSILRRRGLLEFCVNYLDDILIFSKSFEEHLRHVDLLMSAIEQECFKLNFVKCSFAFQEVQYLGHVLSADSVRPLQDNLIAIREFPIPTNRKNVRQFLGKINFYHKFIPNASSVLEPFHNLLRNNVVFSWSDRCQASFEKVEGVLVSSPVRAVFNREKPVIIYTEGKWHRHRCHFKTGTERWV